MQRDIQYLEQQLLQARQMKESVNAQLSKLVDEHNEFIATYDQLYQTYTEYKQAYENLRRERDILRQQVNPH